MTMASRGRLPGARLTQVPSWDSARSSTGTRVWSQETASESKWQNNTTNHLWVRDNRTYINHYTKKLLRELGSDGALLAKISAHFSIPIQSHVDAFR